MRITVFSLLALMRPRCYWLYNSHEPGPPHVVVTLYNCHHPDLSTGSAGSCAGFSIPTTRSRACQAASSIPKLVAQCNPTPAHAAHAAASSPRCASAIIRLSTAATRYRGPPTGGGNFPSHAPNHPIGNASVTGNACNACFTKVSHIHA